MTMRGAIHEMLAGLGLGTDPAEVLAEHGFEDLPPDAVASALVHFAETADLELADAMAPIVTRVSQVPFDEGDLPEIDAEGPAPDPSDVYAMLTEIGLGGRDFAAMVDDGADPDDYADFDDVFDEAPRPLDIGDRPDTETSDADDEPTYGSGGEDTYIAEPASDGADEQYDEQYDRPDPGLGDDAISGVADELGEAYEQFAGDTGFEPIQGYDEGFDDADPSDLDLD